MSKNKRDRKYSPLDYALKSCDTMMRRFDAPRLPPIGRFHYHQGVFLSGMYETYCLSGRQELFAYIKSWVDSCVDQDGNIREFDAGQLDDIQPGILLFPLYEKTGDARYKKALDVLLPIIRDFPRNAEGGFWHKDSFLEQMWLDGLYMAGPICAEYGRKFEKSEYLDLVTKQALLMRDKTRDCRTGLWHHAWDCAKKQDWADPVTGLSPEFWGRSIGWVPVAVLDELRYLPENHPDYEKLRTLVRELLEAVCRYQSEDGRWYQVVDKGGEEGNWLETSCSCLFVAAVCRAVENSILPASYLVQAKKGYEAVIRSLEVEGEDLLVGGVCIGTCVGDYRYYCERPTSVNDLHGVGAVLLMCAAAQKSGL